MTTVATLGETRLKQYPSKLRQKATLGRPDLWTLGLLKSNARLNKSEVK